MTGVVSGFFANVQNTDRRKSFRPRASVARLRISSTNPDRLDSFDQFKTNIKRDVYYWGVGGEARFGKGAEPVPDQGGYLFRFAYIGIGGEVRAIDQNNRLNLNGDVDVNQIKYRESLDTTYAGAYLSVGGEYNILDYLGVGGSWGLRSLISLRAGVYDASTDYSGYFTLDGGSTTHLGLWDDQVAFIGTASFETRKQRAADEPVAGYRL